MQKKITITVAVDRDGVDLADPDRRRSREPLDLPLGGLQHLGDTDQPQRSSCSG